MSLPERPGSRAAPRRAALDVGAVVSMVVIVVGAVVMLVPFVWMLATSLKPASALLTLPPTLLPEAPTLEPYRRVMTAFPMARVFANSAFVAIASTAGQLVVASLSGYAFARFRFPGRDALFYAYVGTLMVPFAVTVTPLFIIVRALGWTDGYEGLIVPTMFSAFGTFLMRQFFMSIPRELEEAATLDGASTWATFVRVILPISGPAFATLGIFSFMASWNAFLWPLLIVADRQYMTLPLALSTLQGLYPGQTEWNMVMAGAVISVVPMILVFLFAQRWVIEGVTSSGLKG